MCGVAGIIDYDVDEISIKVLKQITNSISHRGRDGDGFWIENDIGIGHKRLSIIDLSDAGVQPMFSRDKRYVISYNGEIYNFLELRKELEKDGFVFNSKTDTEVVLNSFIKWGYESLTRFNGMYAFAIWDRKEKELFIARDRYGIKPIYYSGQGSKFIFGSEQRVIASSSGFIRKVNKKALLEYFTFQNIFTDQTLLEDISILPAGYYGILNYDKGKKNTKLKIYNYWDYKFSNPKNSVNRNEYTEELNRLFIQAVERQLVSDVELGSYLSGGIDSGSIVALASKKFSYLKTFTCGFDLNSASELNWDLMRD